MEFSLNSSRAGAGLRTGSSFNAWQVHSVDADRSCNRRVRGYLNIKGQELDSIIMISRSMYNPQGRRRLMLWYSLLRHYIFINDMHLLMH